MKHLKSLNKYFYQYRGRFLLGILFVTVSNIFGIIPAQVVRNALDLVAADIDTYKMLNGFDLKNDFYTTLTFGIAVFIFLILLMALLKGVFMFFMRQTIIVMSRHIEYAQKNEIFNHYQKLNISFYNRQNTGDLMNRISEDVSRVRMYVGPAIMYTINMTVMFILVSYAMFHVNARLSWYVLTPMPVLILVIYYVHDIINKKSEQVQAQLSTLSTFVQEAFSGIRILKSFVRENQSISHFNERAEKYKHLNMDLVRTNALFFPILLILVGVSTLMTIFIGGKEVIAGNITLGNIAEFIIYVNMLTWPVASLGWVVTLVQRAAASQERINEFLHTQPDVVSLSHEPFPIKGNIEFRNVSYTYPHSNTKALQNVSFNVTAGKSLAIIGRTGSGKTTVVNLLLRLMDPSSGEILVDEKNLKEINLDDFRQQSGCVPQDVFLFSDTIANNISFGLKSEVGSQKSEVRPPTSDLRPPDSLLKEAARNAAVYENIMEFPEGFETVVGERGITLSGGQKQRISIARAVIKEPKILIFDDCLSAVDTKTEETILQNLQKIMHGRTTIITSHRVSSVKNADEIIVLAEGKIAERGEHASLIEKCGVYAEIYWKQLLEEEKV
jgi:ATP-binding cassette, subfamily B, multidrug efflux pump